MTQLSILIPTTPDRDQLLKRLFDSIEKSCGGVLFKTETNDLFGFYKSHRFEVLVELDNGEKSIGEKRNMLLSRAQGLYEEFIDSDDMVMDTHFKHIFEGIEKDVDCCSLRGMIFENNSPPRLFEHSIKYKDYRTIKPDPTGFADQFYERFPNHLNCVRTSIAKQIEFPYFNRGEDTQWAVKLFESGLIKTEHFIDDVIYIYEPSDTRK
jgi:hypothetical protein